MTSQTLREARKYEEASEKMIKKEERPETDSLITTDNITCFTSIIRMSRNGDRCTGGMQ